MSNLITPISRRDVLIGGAAVVAATGIPLTVFAGQSKLRALLLRRDKIKEKLR